MAIPTSNITMTGIATELGISTSNISLDSLGDKMIVIDPGSSRQTFTLTDTITLTTDDTSVAANMNTGVGSTKMSEFGGYTKANPIQFSSTNSAAVEQVETINVFHNLAINGCPVLIRLSSIIYAKRVGNDLVWYVGEGLYDNFGQHYKEGSGIGVDTECARLVGVGANTSTTVSVAYSMVTQNPNFSEVILSAVSAGSTSNNLVSTNTKCGYEFRLFGQSSNNNTQQSVVYTMLVKFTVTHPNHVPRVFGFFVGLKGLYTANANGSDNFEC
jgi:hypothetical protein